MHLIHLKHLKYKILIADIIISFVQRSIFKNMSSMNSFYNLPGLRNTLSCLGFSLWTVLLLCDAASIDDVFVDAVVKAKESHTKLLQGLCTV